jgi:cbb3-type cytochrome oxidase cytochrome c subunit
MPKLKLGEKLMFGFAAVVVVAALGKGVMTWRTTTLPREYYEFTDAGLEGHALYRRMGCNNCHRALGVGEIGVAPSLDGSGTRRTQAWLERYFQDPPAQVPGSAHDGRLGPDFRTLSADERRLLVAFLFGLKSNPGSPNYPTPPVDGAPKKS